MPKRQPGKPPVLPGFQFIAPLGAGGFADVFLYEQDMPRRRVAVKVLMENIVDPQLVRMFNAEADAMARLSAHPAILTIYQATISADGRPYIAMEYCPDSYQKRYREVVLPVDEVMQTGVRVCSALETCHRAGVLHRDIKPSNILINTFGTAVLSDFGIATASRASGDEVLALSVPWSAPEVVEGETTGTIASEVYSAGATIYTLLAGRSPFEVNEYGRNRTADLRARIRRGDYIPMGRNDVPRELEEVLARSLAKRPSDRPSSMIELAESLQQCQYHLGLPYTPIEVGSATWGEADSIDFSDTQERGPIRSTVPISSRRVQRSQSRSESRSEEWRGDQEVRGGVSRRKVVAIVGTAVLATAGIATAVFAAAGGLS